MRKRRRRKSGFRKGRKTSARPFKEVDVASRDGAKKWLRRAIESGRVIPETVCESCGDTVLPRAHAYQPNVRKPWEIIWLCPVHSAQAAKVSRGGPASSHSVKDLVATLLKEAERAELLRVRLVAAGAMTQEQAREDEEMWAERVEAAQAAYRQEVFGSDESLKRQLEQALEKEEGGVEEKNPFDILGGEVKIPE